MAAERYRCADVACQSPARVTIFGVPWRELELEHVERFLAGAGREALTWEAKGTELRAEQVTKHVGGFANARDGGYLLLGFKLDDEEWQATGVDFPGDDPPVWVTSVVRTTLRPPPRIDVRDWKADGGKRAAVVRVEPGCGPALHYEQWAGIRACLRCDRVRGRPHRTRPTL
jgi:hypothetical protein